MGTNYTGLVNGNINPIDLAKLIKKTYGGDDFSVHFTSIEGYFQIVFKQNYTEAQLAMRPWERAKVATRRTMSVFIDGECKHDYKDVTTDNMTYVSLGHSGDCREIINALVRSQGGWVKDELGYGDTADEFVRLEVAEAAQAARAQGIKDWVAADAAANA